MKTLSILLILFFSSNIANAHYLWLEKDSDNNGRLFFGEWHKNKIENSEKLERFAAAKVFMFKDDDPVALIMNDNYLFSKTASKNDIRMVLDNLPARENRRKKISKTAYFSKAGRKDTSNKLALELVPTKPNSNTWQLVFNKQPLKNTDVTVYGPPKWEKSFRTNESGSVTIKTPWAGQYLIKAVHKIDPISGTATLKDPALRYLYTGTFQVEKGISWND